MSGFFVAFLAERTTGEHFSIKLSGIVASDTYFSYWIVDSEKTLEDFKGSNGGNGGNGETETPSPQSSPEQGEEEGGESTTTEKVIEETPTSTAP